MDRHFEKSREAARHSSEAHALLSAERDAREVCAKLSVVNFYTKGGFDKEIERVQALIKRLGDRRRRIMKKPAKGSNG